MTYDAIIVGAGPGGATAATFMAEAGLRVLLLDKDRFPRDKVCGDAISGRSIDVMRDLGVTEQLLQADSLHCWGITFAAPSGKAVSIPITEDRGQLVPPAFVCTRHRFDQILFERACTAGVDIRQQTTVDGLLWENDHVVGVQVKQAPNPQSIRAKLVVGADGAYSAVVRALGMPQLEEKYYAAAVRAYYEDVVGFHEKNFMEIHFLDVCVPGYFWIFPMGRGRANVGVGMLSRDVKARGVQLKDLLDACVAHPRFGGRFQAARRVGVVKGWGLPLGSKPRPMAGHGWMLVGDAASLIDPFTAEGIGNAMASGRSAAQWAARACEAGDVSAAFLAGFEREVQGYLRNELRLSHALQRLTGWRALLDFVIGKAGRVPDLAVVLSSMFDDRTQRRRLLSPLFYLRLLAS